MTKRELKCKVNARTLRRKKSCKSTTRGTKEYHKTAGRRLSLRGTASVSSTKIGAGEVTARRRLPMGTLHKRDHRSNKLIGHK